MASDQMNSTKVQNPRRCRRERVMHMLEKINYWAGSCKALNTHAHSMRALSINYTQVIRPFNHRSISQSSSA